MLNDIPTRITMTRLARILEEANKNGLANETWGRAPKSIRDYCEYFVEGINAAKLEGVVYSREQIAVLFIIALSAGVSKERILKTPNVVKLLLWRFCQMPPKFWDAMILNTDTLEIEVVSSSPNPDGKEIGVELLMEIDQWLDAQENKRKQTSAAIN